MQQLTAFGYFLVLGLGMGLPKADYNPALDVTKNPENQAAFEADRDD